MPNKRIQHRPEVVRKNCLKFLAALGRYRHGLEYEAYLRFKHESQPKQWETIRTQLLTQARRLWANLNRYGLRLLAAGKAWNVTEWMESRREWFSIETSGFFENKSADDATGPETTDSPDIMKTFLKAHPADHRAWGSCLQQTLSWCETTKMPFGFSDHEEEKDSDMRDWVIGDVERDVGILLVVANERSFGRDGQIVPPPLTPLQRDVLNLIPFWPEGITGIKIFMR